MARDLRPCSTPRSVAIVGASDDPAKWGNWLGRGALKGEHRRPVYLVNRNGGDGARPPRLPLARRPARTRPSWSSSRCRAAAFEQTVDDALAAGARALSASPPGLGELGRRGAGSASGRWSSACARPARCCSGPTAWASTTPPPISGSAPTSSRPGSIGLISQSGNLALELGILAREYGLGFSRFASIGQPGRRRPGRARRRRSREHHETELIAVYAEDFRDGRAFVDAAAAARQAGRPAHGRRAARRAPGPPRSHTGALVSDAGRGRGRLPARPARTWSRRRTR